ncbi:hypothetical protein [Streptomyces aureocirculatus]|uniref:hypothetical protein n=1 Tax=Streptomyces aureocirculatus TaxID=67275 RepID=UPI0004C5DB96|nr:hypothetical protein [Streptomyces aureocirculatus]
MATVTGAAALGIEFVPGSPLNVLVSFIGAMTVFTRPSGRGSSAGGCWCLTTIAEVTERVK